MSADASRRDFLKASAAVAGTLAAVPLVHAGGAAASVPARAADVFRKSRRDES